MIKKHETTIYKIYKNDEGCLCILYRGKDPIRISYPKFCRKLKTYRQKTK